VGYKTFRESLKINPDTGDLTTTQAISFQGTGTATGGTFTLTYPGGPATSGLVYNATIAAVETALIALPDIQPGDVTVTGAAGNWTATFRPRPGGWAKLTGDGSALTGGTFTVLVAKNDAGTPAINRALTQRGIITTAGTETGTESLTVRDPNSFQNYVEGTDYVVVRLPSVAGGDDATPGTSDDLYTISRVVDGGHIDPGDVIQVSYRYKDPTYHEVWSLYDYDDVRDMYGEPFDAAGNIQSELTLAAKFAFYNGASTVLTCAVDPEDPAVPTMADYADALDKFRDEPQIAIIVPATGQQAVQSLVQLHVLQQSNNRYERRAIIGMDGSTSTVMTTQRILNAEQLTEQRIALVSPSKFTYYAPELNKPIELGGQFMAAALAGLSTSMIAAMPLTRKTVRGFTGPAEAQREGEKNNESQNGLMVIEKTRRNLVQVRHGVTTNPTDLLTREWSIIGQQDVMVYRIRDFLDADGLIGMPIYDTTLIQVKASAESALQSLIKDQIIRNYQNLKVRQIATTPDVLEVRYEWLPAYPLNYIVVRYSVAVLTGDITVTETTL
jgi:hypothetical protein